MSQYQQLIRLGALSGLLLFCSGGLRAETWHIRTDGGDRTQCTGRADAAYPGQGSNQDCAFKHPFFLFTLDVPINRPVDTPKWIIAGGDTVVLHNGEYRVGYKVNESTGYWNYTGCRGDPFNCFNPVIPAGTPENPTRIVGEQWQTGCGVKTRLTGGIGVTAVLNLKGAKNVAVECLEISDFAQCGTGSIGAADGCVRGGYPKSDYALRGLMTDMETDGLLLRNLDIHGMSQMGIRGRIGGTIIAENIRIAGIQGGAWDNDDGGGIHGTGTLILRNSIIEWAGCLEEYPIKSPLPYYKCYDQSHGGYGDGLGILSGEGMRIEIDQSIFRYNVQDGVDLLYVHGVTPSVSVTRSAAYGNGGQQWKFGPFRTINFLNNLTVANCRRFSESFNGIPETYNLNVTDYCRAADGVAVSMTNATVANWYNNTTVGYTATMFDLICAKVMDTFTAAGRGGATPLDASLGLDGARREFVLSSVPDPMDLANGVLVNNVRQTIGVLGVDTGKQWYWSPGTTRLVQDESRPLLGAKDQLVVQYTVPGYCKNTQFNYSNNIFRGYTNLRSKRIPSLFYYIGLDEKQLLANSLRVNNMYCHALKTFAPQASEMFESQCPGNWLASEPVELTNERELDGLDLRLAPESVARDRGIALEPVHDDFEGVHRYYSSAPDIGAYEVAPVESGTTPTPEAAVGGGKIYLRWPHVRSALLYRIQRRAASEAEYTGELAAVLSNAYLDEQVSADQNYCYRIRPFNAVNEGDWGPEVCVLASAAASLPPSFLRNFRVLAPPRGGPSSLPGILKNQAAWLALPVAAIAAAAFWASRRRSRLRPAPFHGSPPIASSL